MKPWNQMSNDEKMDQMRRWYGEAHEYEIEAYYERSNGLGDWWANQEGAVEHFFELINSGKPLDQFPNDFVKWYKRQVKLERGIQN